MKKKSKPKIKDNRKTGWRRIREFVVHDVWDIDLPSAPRLKRLWVRGIRVGHLVVRGFLEDELSLQAAALTFTTLMSLVPFLAFVFSIWKGLGSEDKAITWLHEKMTVMPEQFQAFVEDILRIVENANYLALGGSAFFLLLSTVIVMIGSVEASFNRVWAVATPRNFIRKVKDYISTVVVVSFFIMAATSFSIDTFTGKLAISQIISTSFLKIAPLLSAWLAFSFLYAFMPNTRVRFIPTMISGLVGGLLWLGWQKFYVSTQIGVFKYNQLFGTFATIPIFLFWLYTCWIIVLFGVEVAFAVQNASTFEVESGAARASARTKLKLALAIMTQVGESMAYGTDRFNGDQYAKQKCISIRLLNQVVDILKRAGFIVGTSDKTNSYVLTRTPDAIQAKEIFDVIIHDGVKPETLGIHILAEPVEEALTRIDEGLEKALEQSSLQDLIKRKHDPALSITPEKGSTR
ncbi:MAG: YihY family inner membrane protein [Kiritimatiellae bacterium]|nr:YihY family inner membrane protein [Kiritimatiellia bacterium]